MAGAKRDASLHRGHRERVRKKYLQNGFGAFSDHEVLEFLLYYCNAQHDTNEVAHRLINSFGSLGAVFSAPIDELIKIKGVGKQTAFLIRFISDLMSAQMSDYDDRDRLDNSDKLGDYMMPFFMGLTVETTFAVALDDKKRLIRVIKLGEGSFDSVCVNVPKVTRQLITCGAVSVALLHNHPIGTAIPSLSDIRVTQRFQLAFESVGLELFDHLVVSNEDKDWISMRDSGNKLYAIATEN